MPKCFIMIMYSSRGGDYKRIIMRLDRKIFVLGLFFFIVMTISGIYSLSNTIDGIENPLSIAYVDIELTTDIGDSMVLPGELISLNPKVKNIGINCYLRFKIEYFVNDTKKNYEDLSITVDSNDWVKKGDYFYYKEVFKRNNNVLLFDNLLIPSTYDNKYKDSELEIKITAEAIQADNFNQDLNSNSPWGDVPIKKKVERNYSLDTEGTQTIIYENNSDRYLTVDSKFFNGLVNLKPGDVKTDYINVDNTSKGKLALYLKVESDITYQVEKELLETIKLTITDSSNNTLYDGPLLNSVNNYLKTYGKGEKDKLTLKISVPHDVDNEYSGLLSKIIWSLSCEEENVPVPKTGDEKLDVSIKMFILSFIGFIMCLIFGKMNNDREEKIRKKEEN